MSVSKQPEKFKQVRTQQELALEVGVSRKTVSRALMGHPEVDEKTRARIKKMANSLGYRPSSAARVMRGEKNKQIGVVIRNNPRDRFTHLMVFEMILGINEGLQDDGYVLSIIRIGDVDKALEESSRVFKEEMLDGIVLCCCMPPAIESSIEQYTPNVVYCETNQWNESNCVRRDEYSAGQMAASKLIELGYRKIIWIRHPPFTPKDNYSSPVHYIEQDRENGLFDVFASHSDVSVQDFPIAYDSPITFSRACDFIRNLTPDVGVIAPSLYQARWLQSACASLGRNPPYDFGLVCCDDSTDISTMWPGLSRVKFDRFEMGYIAANLMLKQLDESKGVASSELVKCGWVAGNSAWGPDALKH